MFSSSRAATAVRKGTRRLWWSSRRTRGSTASYLSLQMSPRMWAADAEMGWRAGPRGWRGDRRYRNGRIKKDTREGMF